jgi:hypothetical protein
MSSPLEYHVSVRPSISTSLALLGLLALPAFLVSTSHAQINGTPSSVTSPGFGGRPVNGPPASVTSLGPRGYAPSANVPHNGNGQHVHRHTDKTQAPLLYAYPVPYAVDLGAANNIDNGPDADADDANYQGGPTIFDRRGSGASSYIPPVEDVARPHAQDDANASAAADDPPQPPTVLIFKDGRKLDVGNYAIVGSTLFDLTPGHSRKVPLSDLDLEATRQQNDERGITFQLPQSLQAN